MHASAGDEEAEELEGWTEYSRFLTALLVIVDPFAAIPLFLALTQDYARADTLRVARLAAVTVAIVLVLSALAGEAILTWLGTSLASFRVGGGIVLMMMALALLRARPEERDAELSRADAARPRHAVAFVPLAVPLLAGPGAIGTVIIEMHRVVHEYHVYLVIACILLASCVLWLTLRMALPIAKALGQVGLSVANRLFGLILVAIAVEIIANGLRELFPVLRG